MKITSLYLIIGALASWGACVHAEGDEVVLNQNIADPLVVKSYFGEGFGLLMERDVYLRRVAPEVGYSRDKDPVWYLFKDAKAEKPEDGILVKFFATSDQTNFDDKSKGVNFLRVKVVGYEAVESFGEPRSRTSSLQEKSKPLKFVEWRVWRFFMIRNFEIL